MDIKTCSVTVMRSHDYCHFSVTLGGDLTPRSGTASQEGYEIIEVDELRKMAARLADKAVEQYKIKKNSIELGENHYTLKRLREAAEEAEKISEPDRTEEQKAAIKAYGDLLHATRYDYDDGWDPRPEGDDDE